MGKFGFPTPERSLVRWSSTFAGRISRKNQACNFKSLYLYVKFIQPSWAFPFHRAVVPWTFTRSHNVCHPVPEFFPPCFIRFRNFNDISWSIDFSHLSLDFVFCKVQRLISSIRQTKETWRQLFSSLNLTRNTENSRVRRFVKNTWNNWSSAQIEDLSKKKKNWPSVLWIHLETLGSRNLSGRRFVRKTRSNWPSTLSTHLATLRFRNLSVGRFIRNKIDHQLFEPT